MTDLPRCTIYQDHTQHPGDPELCHHQWEVNNQARMFRWASCQSAKGSSHDKESCQIYATLVDRSAVEDVGGWTFVLKICSLWLMMMTIWNWSWHETCLSFPFHDTKTNESSKQWLKSESESLGILVTTLHFWVPLFWVVLARASSGGTQSVEENFLTLTDVSLELLWTSIAHHVEFQKVKIPFGGMEAKEWFYLQIFMPFALLGFWYSDCFLYVLTTILLACYSGSSQRRDSARPPSATWFRVLPSSSKWHILLFQVLFQLAPGEAGGKAGSFECHCATWKGASRKSQVAIELNWDWYWEIGRGSTWQNTTSVRVAGGPSRCGMSPTRKPLCRSEPVFSQ